MVVCHFFSRPGGCRNGASCRFDHPTPSGASSLPPSASWRSTASSEPKPRHDVKEWMAGAPRGSCRDFWLKGSCSKPFGTCTFRHEHTKASTGSSGTSRLPPVHIRPIHPTVAVQGPAELAAAAAGASSDAVAPTSVNLLRVDRGVLYKVSYDPSLRFETTTDVYRFLNSLYASTQVKRHLSTHEDAQNVLAELASQGKPGAARLADCLNFPLSPTAGSSSKVLSFQRGFMVLVYYLTSDEIRTSVFTHHVNVLYHALYVHAGAWVPATISSIESLVAAKSVADPNLPGRWPGFNTENFVQVFSPLAQLLAELFSRFRDAVVQTPALRELVTTLSTSFALYAEDMASDDPSFDRNLDRDPRRRQALVEGVRRSIDILPRIIERSQAVAFVSTVPTPSLAASLPSCATMAVLRRLFEPPGALREGGPRHDNDKASIRDIQILPTHEELLCSLPAFVPSNLPDAPHHLPANSMERQLDIIFRLLRADFVGPLCAAVSSLFHDLGRMTDPKNPLASLLARGGGRYRPTSSVHADSSDLNVYAGVKFANVQLSEFHELQLNLQLRFPAHFGKSHVVRHLTTRSLVGLICRRRSPSSSESRGTSRPGAIDSRDAKVYLGLVTQEGKSIGAGQRLVGVSFFDGDLYLDAVARFNDERSGRTTDHGEMLAFEVPGFLLGTLQPFLRALQSIEPAALPFAKYLSAPPPADDCPITIDPPLYARIPGFAYDLSGVLKEPSPPGTLTLDLNDPHSVVAARDALVDSSKLDPSQAEAMIECLSREVALVRGPPGTGKSYLGVELIRVLLAAKVGTILILSYTNHALDTLLRHLKHEGVTNKIVRAGSRSQDPEMEEFNLNALAVNAVRLGGRVDYEGRELLRARREIELKMQAVCDVATRLSTHGIRFDFVAEYLCQEYPIHLEYLRSIPAPVQAASTAIFDGDWQIAGSAKGKKKSSGLASSNLPSTPYDIFSFWRDGHDVDLLARAQLEHDAAVEALAEQKAKIDEARRKTNFSVLPIEGEGHGGSDNDSDASSIIDLFEDARLSDAGSNNGETGDEAEEEEEHYAEPTTDRSIVELEAIANVWSWRRAERAKMIDFWSSEMVRLEGPKLARLRAEQERINERLKNLKNDAKCRILKNAEVIGATTNSASNLLSIISSVQPTVLVVEEAGECLEAQVVANLVPSIKHLIMIGDEKQLRPQIASYHLSTDSAQGSVHRHDVSLLERLATLPLPISMLRTQRRMQPEISGLIRNYLYPDLEDAPQVLDYPDVCGMRKNVYFVDHRIPEDSQAADHSSKSNSGEAAFVVDLVRHLLRQGYRAGNIAIIVPYLGQLAALKRLLERESLPVALDDRDVQDLLDAKDRNEDEGDEDEPVKEVSFVPVKATMKSLKSQVELRTIDRFQGEEADIVILSLVRNSSSGLSEEEPSFFNLDRAAKASIGFLKSPNRTNVAISRAKHGMYLFGDAGLLSSRSRMWESVIDNLEEQGLVGPHLPACCDNHPDVDFAIDAPGKLPTVSPEGGCFKACDTPLPCGHLCRLQCHPADPQHRTIGCTARCPVLLPCSHPCAGICSEPHPECTFNILKKTLDCGHVAKNVACHISTGVEKIKCLEKVRKTLPCGHEEVLACHVDPAKRVCAATCDSALDCLHAVCRARCADCRALQSRTNDPTAHQPHAHEKALACGHLCGGSCAEHVKAGSCPSTCDKPCPRACSHSACMHRCQDDCPNCLSPCDFCNLPCSAPCNRLPTNAVCKELLACGCPCPSLETEPCEKQVCPKCALPDRKTDVVDFILMSTLADFDPNDPDPSQRLITIDCGHTFTVETLDGLFEIELFYSRDSEGNFVGLAHPEFSDKTPPVCPSCKSKISSRFVKRYGRPLKHGQLIVQERLRMLRGQEEVARMTDMVAALPSSAIVARAKGFKVHKRTGKDQFTPAQARERQAHLLKHAFGNVIGPFAFAVPPFTALPSTLQNFWTKLTRPLLHALFTICEGAHRPSKQMEAYQAAVNQLFHVTREEIIRNGEAVRDLDKFAFEYALTAVGTAAPHAASQTHLRLVWLSLDVRFSLADVAFTLADALWTANPTRDPHQIALVNLAVFILKTTIRDAQVAISTAESNQSGRQAIEGRLHLLRAQHELSRLFGRCQLNFDLAKRDAIVKRVSNELETHLRAFQAAVETFAIDRPDNRGWLDEEIMPNYEKVARQWDDFRSYAREATLYRQVTQEERLMVIRASAFASSSHWYTCPNGHTFSIGECGGAASVGKCAECGTTIGGSGHRVVAGNRHDDEMIRLAQQAGAREFFPWGHQ
ncbi:hypothetical protein JCM10212_002747 [Sporobolomyces blumeae]